MRFPLGPLVLVGVALAACGKSAQEKAADLEECSATSTKAPDITKCLKEERGWSGTAAESAGVARQRELDSVSAQIGAITAQADSQHESEMHECDHVLVDLKSCLITRFGWDEDQATKTDDSLWTSRSVLHQRQIRSCLGSRRVGTGACLQLHYKWPPRRALALDDSIRRANLPR